MTIGEGIQRLQSLYNKGVQSDDTRLTPRHAYSALLSGRNLLLNQQSNKGQIAGEWAIDTLPCIELIKAPIHECPCIPGNGCMILRSKHKIPNPVIGLDKHLIKSITSMDGSIRFDEETFETQKYAIGNKYTSKKPSFFIKNEYLFITVLKQLQGVTGRGLFHDPIEVFNFPSICDPCEECKCKDIMELEFKMAGHLQKAFFDLAYNELIIIMKQITEDKSNNASDDTETRGQMIHQGQQQG